MFKHYLRVRYGECDAQKVVFNSRYADYVDVSVNEFLRAAGLEGEMVHGPYDFQLVKQTVEWKGPARFDDVLEISVSALRLGNTSFTLGAEVRKADNPSLIAAVETVYVLVDAKTMEKLTIPDHVRSALAAGAAGVSTDHAGYFPRGGPASAAKKQSGN
jgi:acyl-CoA thioester hydrolase